MFERTLRRIQRPRSNRPAAGPRRSRRAPRPISLLAARWRPWHTVVALGLLAPISVGVGLAWGAWNRICLSDRCPSIAQITVWEPEQSSKLYARDGSLIHEFFKERRTVIDLADLPPYVPQAFIAIEDKRFYRHHGLDYLRFARATLEYIVYGPGRPGGSTIT
ncbi:MAG: transglycosylase domain-containing protein, partial [Gemmatimonadota bacterium]